jgi:O-antigen/teichoic acid export membrane protein
VAVPLLRRRAGAAVGTYLSIGLGFLASVVAARKFSTEVLGLFALVVSASQFFKVLADLTIEEALIKYGFRYVTQEDWGRLGRLFRQTMVFKVAGSLLAAGGVLGLAALSGPVFGHTELRLPMAIGAATPVVQAPESVAAVPLMLHGRYDLRGGLLAFSMALRLVAIAVAASHGLAWTIGAVVAAQGLGAAVASVAGVVAFRRFPSAPHRPLGDDVREIRRFVVHSSLATGVVSLRSTLTPLVLGVVSTARQVGFFRVAQSPQQGFAAVSAPVRLVLLSEQTRDWERGERERVFAGIRRYSLLAAAGCLVLVPPLLVWMPSIVRVLFEAKNLGAVSASRIIVLAGAVQLLVGWSKSFVVTIGRPQLRIWTHGVETVVLLPLAALLGRLYGASGVSAAVLASSVAYAVYWAVLFERIRREAPAPLPPGERAVAGTELRA